jgi:uncharacterized protein YcbX
MQDLKLSEIWIYPVKSLGGIRLNSAKVVEKGLPYDRRWMLTDENGMFLTQRILPRMALFKLSMNDDHLTVRYGANSVHVPLIPKNDHPLQNAIIWDDTVLAQEVDPIISAWFSLHLEKACRLLYFPEGNPRPVDAAYKVNEENVSLADAYPFLIIGESSLAYLNEKLADPIGMDRFRPNFVFSGGNPHDEDNWREFTIGTNRFVGVKPCAGEI